MDWLGEIIQFIKSIFTLSCPECNGKLEFYNDSTLDKNVYECKECKKEFI